MSRAESSRMTVAELQLLLDRFGSDLARWPEDDARAAEQLLADSSQARTELDAARALDHWLGGLRTHRAPAGLATAIMDQLKRSDSYDPLDLLDRFIIWLTARRWRPLLAAALPVVAGFLIGFGIPEQDDNDLAGQIATLAFVDIYVELDDAEQP